MTQPRASKRKRSNKLLALRPSWRNWRAGVTNSGKTGGTVLHSMFKTGHALPLRAEGFCVRESVAVKLQIIRAI